MSWRTSLGGRAALLKDLQLLAGGVRPPQGLRRQLLGEGGYQSFKSAPPPPSDVRRLLLILWLWFMELFVFSCDLVSHSGMWILFAETLHGLTQEYTSCINMYMCMYMCMYLVRTDFPPRSLRSCGRSVCPFVRAAVLAGLVGPTGLLGLCGSVRVRPL